MTAGTLGVILTPANRRRPAFARSAPCWAADNGCYSQGERFDLDAYLRWLAEMAEARDTCLFATAPDVVGDATATWERSRDVLPLIRGLGYPSALVAQDGLDVSALDWSAFDALFVGGTTGYKLSEGAYALAREAKRRAKWCHMGRVNSRRRIRAAAISGYDSVDGTHLARKPDERTRQLVRWLGELERQPSLW